MICSYEVMDKPREFSVTIDKQPDGSWGIINGQWRYREGDTLHFKNSKYQDWRTQEGYFKGVMHNGDDTLIIKGWGDPR